MKNSVSRGGNPAAPGVPVRSASVRKASYRHVPPVSTTNPLDEHERPILAGYAKRWPESAMVIGATVDADEWPAWTDEVAFGLAPDQEGGRP